MTHYLFRRLWQSLLVLFGVSLIVFILLHLSGDPAILMMPPDATKEDIENFRKLMASTIPSSSAGRRGAFQPTRSTAGFSAGSCAGISELIPPPAAGAGIGA